MRLPDHVHDHDRAGATTRLDPTPAADATPPPVGAHGIRVRRRPRRLHLLRRTVRRLRGLLGGLLVTFAAAFGWLLIVLPFHVAMDLSGGDDDLTADERAVFDAAGRLLVLVLVGATGAWIAGRHLMRVRRGTVLWLRKFQDRDATRVVGAALDHIGRTWRVVTLDDLSTPPVGVALGLRLPGRLLTLAGRAGPRIASLAVTVGRVLTKGCIAGLVALAVWAWSQGELLLLLEALPGSGPRPDTVEADLLLVLLGLLVGQFVLLLAFVAVSLALLPLFGLLMLVGGVHQQVTDTETAKLRTVRGSGDIPAVAASVVAASQRALAPRLTVLRVDGAVWQQTVTTLARSCCAVVLDVSRPTEHVLWEVEQVTGSIRARIVFVAHADSLERLLDPAVRDDLTVRLRALLAGAEVLAYTTDLRGRIRFQRALFAELEATVGRARLDSREVRRTLVALVGGAAFVVAVQRALDVLSPWL